MGKKQKLMLNHIRNKHRQWSIIGNNRLAQSLGKALQTEREKTRLVWWGINRRGEK